jgi:hypothetical protein
MSRGTGELGDVMRVRSHKDRQSGGRASVGIDRQLLAEVSFYHFSPILVRQ